MLNNQVNTVKNYNKKQLFVGFSTSLHLSRKNSSCNRNFSEYVRVVFLRSITLFSLSNRNFSSLKFSNNIISRCSSSYSSSNEEVKKLKNKTLKDNTVKSVSDLFDIVKSQSETLNKDYIKSVKADLPHDGFTLIFKYKKRLLFMTSMTEVLDTINKSYPQNSQEKQDALEGEIQKLVDILGIENDISELSVTTLVDPKDNTPYESSFKKFKNKMERHLIVVSATNSKFPEYKIQTLEQLNDAMKFDSNVREFVLMFRRLLTEVSSMKPILFQVEMPYPLFKEFMAESQELKRFNKTNSELIEKASSVFDNIIKFESENRRNYLSTQSKALQVANYTYEDLPRYVHVNIISTALSGSEKDRVYTEALQYFKKKLLHEIAGTEFNDTKNIFFNPIKDQTVNPSNNIITDTSEVLPSEKSNSRPEDEE